MSTPLEYGDRDSLGYTRHCHKCKKYAPESWASGLCHDCYADHSARLEQERRDTEQARWNALKSRAQDAESRVAELEAGIRELAVAMSGVGHHGEECIIPDAPCSCGLVEFRVAARALVADRTAPSVARIREPGSVTVNGCKIPVTHDQDLQIEGHTVYDIAYDHTPIVRAIHLNVRESDPQRVLLHETLHAALHTDPQRVAPPSDQRNEGFVRMLTAALWDNGWRLTEADSAVPALVGDETPEEPT